MAEYKKVIHVLFGSEVDLPHVQKVTDHLKQRGWRYEKGPCDGEKTYTVGAGSVHRDIYGTLGGALTLSFTYPPESFRSIFLTCIGLRDEASGVLSSYTGKRVVAIPPDIKEYGKYPKGVCVTAFSSNPDREKDIVAAMDWIETEFDNPNWNSDNEANNAIHIEKRDALKVLKKRIELEQINF